LQSDPTLNLKRLVLLACAVASFLSGAADQFFYPGRAQTPIDFWLIIVFAPLIFAWYRLDTDQHDYRRTPLLSLGVVAMAAIVLPFYFFRSRGARGGFVALALFILALFGSGVLTLAGEYAIYYAVQG
jgi:hypothetical protein